MHPMIECGKKELNALLKTDLAEIAAIYSGNFRGAETEQLLGDVSADYSTLPTNPGVAERALKVAPDLKIVYIVRDPVWRALSHHKHMVNWSGAGRMPQDVNVAVENHPELMSYSCYAMQLQPWIEAFGLENILVVKFEDYVGDRTVVASRVCRFLGLPETELVLSEAGANRGESRRYAGKMVFLLLRKNQQPTTPPTRASLEKIVAGVSADIAKFETLLGFKEPLWNLEASIEHVLLKAKVEYDERKTMTVINSMSRTVRGWCRHLALDACSSLAGFRGQLGGFDDQCCGVQLVLLHRIQPHEEQKFEQFIVWLTKNFKVVSYSRAVEIIESGERVEPTIAISFDDGFKDNLKVRKLKNSRSRTYAKMTFESF